MLKRIGAIVLTIAMLLSMACTFSVASAAGQMALEVVVRDDKTNVNPGDKITIDVYVANQSAALYAVTVLGKYDATKWDLQASDISTDLPSSMQFIPILNPVLGNGIDANISATWMAGSDTLPGSKYKFFSMTFTAKEVTENPGSAFSFWLREGGVLTSEGAYSSFSTAKVSKTVMVEKIVPTIAVSAAEVKKGESVNVTVGVDQYHGNMLKGFGFIGKFDATKFDATITNLPVGVTATPIIDGDTFKVTLTSATAIADPTFTVKLTAKGAAALGATDVSVAFMNSGMMGNDITVVYGSHYSTVAVKKAITIAENESAAVAMIGSNTYQSVAEALAAATSGKTVVLMKDCADTATVSVINTGVTLDLNGYTLTANNILSFGNVIDSATDDNETATVGGIKISNNTANAFVSLQAGNTYLPIYDSTNGCYRFFKYDFKVSNPSYKYNAEETPNSVKFGYQLVLDNEVGYQLLANESNERGFDIHVDVEWDVADGKRGTSITFRTDTLAEFAEGTLNKFDEIQAGTKSMGALTLTVNGLNLLAEGATITTASTLQSVTNVEKGTSSSFQKSNA